jgi:TRAP-type C4-dicarboxylate transport system substrate-binding protein
MNKSTFEGLNEAQQKALLAAAEKAEAYYLEEAKKQDAAIPRRSSRKTVSRSRA